MVKAALLLLCFLARAVFPAPAVLEEVRDTDYTYHCALSKSEVFGGSVITISNNVRKKFNVAGKPVHTTETAGARDILQQTACPRFTLKPTHSAMQLRTSGPARTKASTLSLYFSSTTGTISPRTQPSFRSGSSVPRGSQCCSCCSFLSLHPRQSRHTNITAMTNGAVSSP